jgi:hypothetical protein
MGGKTRCGRYWGIIIAAGQIGVDVVCNSLAPNLLRSYSSLGRIRY